MNKRFIVTCGLLSLITLTPALFGTNLYNDTLFDLKVDVTFCKPRMSRGTCVTQTYNLVPGQSIPMVIPAIPGVATNPFVSIVKVIVQGHVVERRFNYEKQLKQFIYIRAGKTPDSTVIYNFVQES